MKIITLLNRKGGVGKTTLSFHLAGELAKHGKVLLIDNDPQANLSQILLGSRRFSAIEPTQSVTAVYRRLPVSVAELAVPVWESTKFIDFTAYPVLLVPSHESLGAANVANPHEATLEEQGAMVDWLFGFEDFTVDFVLIDCPPNLQLCSWAALAASTHLLIPTLPSRPDMLALHPMIKFLTCVRHGNPTLSLLGIAVNRMEETNRDQRKIEDTIRGQHPGECFRTIIPKAAPFGEAMTRGLPLCILGPSSKAGRAMAHLATEILGRLRREDAEEVGYGS